MSRDDTQSDGKTSRTRVTHYLTRHFSAAGLQSLLHLIDPPKLLAQAGRLAQSSTATNLGTGITIFLSAYFLSDLSSLVLEKLLPDAPEPRALRSGFSSLGSMDAELYSPIALRNLFNSRGLIPGLDNQEAALAADSSGPATKTSLALSLVGTVIMAQEGRSLATIEDKESSRVYPMQAGDEIIGKIRLLSVDSTRATFINKLNSKKEYVELPVDPLGRPKLITTAGPSPIESIEKVSPTQFNISRSEVDRALSDLNKVLTQARVAPGVGRNGQPEGYKFFQIVPGSIYDKLGIKNGDLISGINGSPITDPSQALALLDQLKTSSHLELQIRPQDAKVSTTYIYEIH